MWWGGVWKKKIPPQYSSVHFSVVSPVIGQSDSAGPSLSVRRVLFPVMVASPSLDFSFPLQAPGLGVVVVVVVWGGLVGVAAAARRGGRRRLH